MNYDEQPEDPLLDGTMGCPGEYEGDVYLLETPDDEFEDGGVLVTEMTDPRYVPKMAEAGAIITDEGGMTSHPAIVAREYNTPALVGTEEATDLLEPGDQVRVVVGNRDGYAELVDDPSDDAETY